MEQPKISSSSGKVIYCPLELIAKKYQINHTEKSFVTLDGTKVNYADCITERSHSYQPFILSITNEVSVNSPDCILRNL